MVRFSRGTEAYKKLEAMFRSNSIEASDRASDIRQRDPLFLNFNVDQFRGQFNKLKALYGLNTRNTTGEGKYTASVNLTYSFDLQ